MTSLPYETSGTLPLEIRRAAATRRRATRPRCASG